MGGLGVLFHMAFAGDLQLAAQAADGFAHPAFGECLPGALFDPCLGVAGLAEFPLAKLLTELVGEGAPHGWAPGSRPVALEQPLDAPVQHLVPVGENGLAAHGGDFHDLGYGVFVLGDQPHHEQALARPILLRKPPGDFDLLDNVFSKFWQGSHAEGKIG